MIKNQDALEGTGFETASLTRGKLSAFSIWGSDSRCVVQGGSLGQGTAFAEAQQSAGHGELTERVKILTAHDRYHPLRLHRDDRDDCVHPGRLRARE